MAPGPKDSAVGGTLTDQGRLAKQFDSVESGLGEVAQQIDMLRRQVETLRSFRTAPVQLVGGAEHWGAVEHLTDLDTVSALLSDEAKNCWEEVLTIQPGGGRPANRLADAIQRDTEIVSRGVMLRTLYQHSARSDLATQDYVERLTVAGAQYRTLAQLPDRMVIFDRTAALLPVRSGVNGGDRGEAALLVREPAIVEYVCRMFDTLWDLAEPFHGSGVAVYREVGGDLRAAIIRLLAEGVKDEVVARRLGMSLRTCRRHIAGVMRELGAQSRFQAGVLAERGRGD